MSYGSTSIIVFSAFLLLIKPLLMCFQFSMSDDTTLQAHKLTIPSGGAAGVSEIRVTVTSGTVQLGNVYAFVCVP